MTSIDFPHKPLRIWLLVIAIPIFLAVAWTDTLDDRSETYIENALIGGATIYATARGINALVSVLQGTEITPPFFTFTVGQVLDPINDLIERFSAILLVALGSLAMQRLLLELASHTLFNGLLTAMGIATIIVLLWGKRGAYQAFVKFFLVTILIRFTLAIVVAVNGAIDIVFFQEPEAANLREMQAFENRLKLASSQANINATLTDDIEATRRLRKETSQALDDAVSALDKKELELAAAQSELEGMSQQPFWRLWADDSAQVTAQKKIIEDLNAEVDALETDFDIRKAGLEAIDEKLECLRLREKGESCNWLETIKKTGSLFDVQSQLDGISRDVNEFVDNTIRLLVSLLVRSVVLPILLLLIAVSWCRVALRTRI